MFSQFDSSFDSNYQSNASHNSLIWQCSFKLMLTIFFTYFQCVHNTLKLLLGCEFLGNIVYLRYWTKGAGPIPMESRSGSRNDQTSRWFSLVGVSAWSSPQCFDTFGDRKGTWHLRNLCNLRLKVKVKAFPYSIQSVGPAANPGVQAVNPQVTISHPPGGRLPLHSARPAVTSQAAEHHRPLAGTKLYCLVTEAHRYEQLAQGC